MNQRRIVVGATGASGMPILFQCMRLIKENSDYQVSMVLSEAAKLTWDSEMKQDISNLYALADEILDPKAIGAGPASGSYKTEGMLVVPCSMKTVAGIRCGYTDNLILRAADVTIKEKRPLVLAARETPLNPIHLENLYTLSKLQNVWIIPPMMTFYHQPQNMDEMIYHMAAKLTEPFGIEAKEYRRWKGI